MYYKVDIFFRNVHHLSDGRYAAGIWAKWASFNFDKSSTHYISPVNAAEVIGWMSGPEIVAEFGRDATFEQMKDICDLLKISSIMLPSSSLTQEMENHFENILFSDDKKGPNKRLTKDSSEVDIDDIYLPQSLETIEANAILNRGFSTICLEGQNEEKPGTADYESLNEFLENLEE